MGKGLWACSRDNEDDEAQQVVKNELVLSQALSRSEQSISVLCHGQACRECS